MLTLFLEKELNTSDVELDSDELDENMSCSDESNSSSEENSSEDAKDNAIQLEKKVIIFIIYLYKN